MAWPAYPAQVSQRHWRNTKPAPGLDILDTIEECTAWPAYPAEVPPRHLRNTKPGQAQIYQPHWRNTWPGQHIQHRCHPDIGGIQCSPEPLLCFAWLHPCTIWDMRIQMFSKCSPSANLQIPQAKHLLVLHKHMKTLAFCNVAIEAKVDSQGHPKLTFCPSVASPLCRKDSWHRGAILAKNPVIRSGFYDILVYMSP